MRRPPVFGSDSARAHTARRGPTPGTKAPHASRTKDSDRRSPSQRAMRPCAGRIRQQLTTPQRVAESGVCLRTPESNELRQSDTPLRLLKVGISSGKRNGSILAADDADLRLYAWIRGRFLASLSFFMYSYRDQKGSRSPIKGPASRQHGANTAPGSSGKAN